MAHDARQPCPKQLRTLVSAGFKEIPGVSITRLYRGSPVNIFAMGHTQNQDRTAVIINPANYAIVPDSIPPETRFITGQDFPVLTGVSLPRNALLKKTDDASLRDAVESLDFTQGARLEVNGPGQVVPPLLRVGW